MRLGPIRLCREKNEGTCKQHTVWLLVGEAPPSLATHSSQNGPCAWGKNTWKLCPQQPEPTLVSRVDVLSVFPPQLPQWFSIDSTLGHAGHTQALCPWHWAQQPAWKRHSSMFLGLWGREGPAPSASGWERQGREKDFIVRPGLTCEPHQH